MLSFIKKVQGSYNSFCEVLVENKLVKNISVFLTDYSTFKKTIILSLFYVFLFYLPFTFITLVFNNVVFFQLDYLYQFSTIIFDFRNRIMDLNFSTWDFKNSLGYDYFANFYYIPLDFSLLPYFLFPFLSYSKLMWLSFLLKVLAGTAAFSYLLKLYKLSNKTILFTSIIYGTADLFFAQNVFPSYTGLTFYIPLILIAIELIFQKKNYLFFSFVIFQIFLFNFYWAWALSLFMAIVLFFRYIFTHFTLKNFYKLMTYFDMLNFISICLVFYILGLALAAFFFLPIVNIMMNEPRMTDVAPFKWMDSLVFDKMVYFKIFLKMLIPNLYMYSGFFYDSTESYWLPTNHIIIYSSILASFTLFQFIIYPNHFVKKRLNNEQLKIYKLLKFVTILFTVLMFIPLTSYAFSLTTSAYLRWLVFYGTLLIISFAFLYEYKIFNKLLFFIYLIISVAYLGFSLYYNLNFKVYRSTFFGVDESVVCTLIGAYSIIIVIFIILRKKMYLEIVLFIEKFVLMGLIFTICVSSSFTQGVRHVDIYGKEVNNLVKKAKLKNDYNIMFDFLYYNDYSDIETMADMAYLYDFNINNNFNIFHSLINPYYSLSPTNNAHKRYYRALDSSYFYYYYMDPTLFILSNSKTNGINNLTYDPSSNLIGFKDIKELESTISIYERDPKFSIGTGFSTYYIVDNDSKFDNLWLDSFYISDETLIDNFIENGFFEEDVNYNDLLNKVKYFNIEDYELNNFGSQYKFKEIPINVSNEKSDVLLIKYYNQSSIKGLFMVDKDDKINKCFNSFCFIPDSGIKKVIVAYNQSNKGFSPYGIKLYTVNKEVLQAKTEELQKYTTYDVKIKGNKIYSKLDNDKPVLMTYKIGYAKGWDVYVDNKKVETYPSHTGQLSFMLKETGTHEITLKYHTPWLKEGLLISSCSLVIFILLVKYKKKLFRGNND